MGGRKNPKETEQEKRREYRLSAKRGYGDEVVGDQAEWLDEMGGAGEKRKEREEWLAKHGHEGTHRTPTER